MLKFFILILFITVSYAEQKKFNNYTLYKIYHKNEHQLKLIQDLMNSDVGFDFWSDPVSSVGNVDILTSPEQRNQLVNFIDTNDLAYEVSIEDIQTIIDTQKVATESRFNMRSMQWTSYYTMDSINAWLDELVATYPDIVTLLDIGTSYEGRSIKGIKISHGAGKRAVFIEGGIHAREWISPATVNYMANQLLTSDEEDVKAAAEEFDWYIFPVTNPDGYVFTHTTNRMWRKNRRPVNEEYGIDLNRNWDSNWLLYNGASSDPSSNTYAGTAPLSEPETLNLANFIRSIGSSIDLYLSFHSYGHLLLLPYGNSTTPYANYYDAMNIGRRAMGALSVRYGTQYITGNVAEAIYVATGTSIDWVKDEINVPLVYTYELRDLGATGFLLPAEQILPTAEETLDSVLDLIHQAKRFGYMNSAATAKVAAASLLMAALSLLLV